MQVLKKTPEGKKKDPPLDKSDKAGRIILAQACFYFTLNKCKNVTK
jgi:hypothetical protein